MRSIAFPLAALLALAFVAPVDAHMTRFGDVHLQFTVTLGHKDGPVWTDCMLHMPREEIGWYVLKHAINQSCIGQWRIDEEDGQHLACIDDICETRATEWIFYLNETRICKDPCVFFLHTFGHDEHLKLVYTNHEAAEVTDRRL